MTTTECGTCGYVNGHWAYCPERPGRRPGTCGNCPESGGMCDTCQEVEWLENAAPTDDEYMAAYDEHQAAQAMALLERVRGRR